MSPGGGADEARGSGRSGLDPADDPEGWERRVEAITAAAEPELSRRSRELAPAFGLQLERWARPVLTTAAGLIVAGTALLVLSGQPPRGGAGPVTSASPDTRGETLVSPVVDPWLGSDTLTIEAVEELVTVDGRPTGSGGLR